MSQPPNNNTWRVTAVAPHGRPLATIDVEAVSASVAIAKARQALRLDGKKRLDAIGLSVKRLGLPEHGGPPAPAAFVPLKPERNLE